MKILKNNIVDCVVKLETRQVNLSWTSRLFNFIKTNKIISITLAVFFMCVSLNLVLIYNFMRIIQCYK